MFSNTTPLNWFNTLRRLKKEGNFEGHLGKELGLLPGRKAFTSQLQGATKHKPTHILTEAATPATKHIKAHKPRKNIKVAMALSGATGGDNEPHELYSFPALSPESNPVADAPSSAGTQRTLLSPSPSRNTFRARLEAAREDIETLKSPERVEHHPGELDERKAEAEDRIRALAAAKIQAGGRGRKARLTLASLKAEKAAAVRAAPPSPEASVRDATAALLSPSTAVTRNTPAKTPPSPQDPLARMEAGLPPKVSGGHFTRASSAKKAKVRSESEVLNALSRLAYGTPPRSKGVPTLLPKAKTPSPPKKAPSPPKIKGLGAAKAAAVAKAKPVTPVKPTTPAKPKTPVQEVKAQKTPESMRSRIKKAATKLLEEQAEKALEGQQEAPKKSFDRLSLKTAKWPGTLAIARKHMSNEEIEKVIGEPLVLPVGEKSKQYTPEKTKKLKAALNERLPA